MSASTAAEQQFAVDWSERVLAAATGWTADVDHTPTTRSENPKPPEFQYEKPIFGHPSSVFARATDPTPDPRHRSRTPPRAGEILSTPPNLGGHP